MITRREIVIALGAGALAPRASFAQAQGKIWRVGFLQAGNRPANGLPPAPLRQALAELGYAEGKNAHYEGRWAEGKVPQLPELANELVQRGVDVIAATGWPAARAAKNATSTIPVVIAFAGDAVGAGHVASLAHPGANVTGISDLTIELSS